MRATDKVQDSPSTQRRPVAHFDGNEDEPRDEGGKWTSGGSAGPGAAKGAVRGHAKSQAAGADADHKGREARAFSEHAAAASAKAGSNLADHAAAKMANMRAAAAHDAAAVAFDEAGKRGDAAAHRDMAAGHAAQAARHESAAQMLPASSAASQSQALTLKNEQKATTSTGVRLTDIQKHVASLPAESAAQYHARQLKEIQENPTASPAAKRNAAAEASHLSQALKAEPKGGGDRSAAERDYDNKTNAASKASAVADLGSTMANSAQPSVVGFDVARRRHEEAREGHIQAETAHIIAAKAAKQIGATGVAGRGGAMAVHKEQAAVHHMRAEHHAKEASLNRNRK